MITDILTIDLRSVIETVLAVSALIILVLLARKVVAREFGPGLAYALWLLPLARLVLPPLPNGMSWVSLLGLAPSASMVEIAGESPMVFNQMPLFMEVPTGTLAHDIQGVRAVIVPPEAPVDAPVEFLSGADLSATVLTTLLGIWIVGALIVIGRNAAAQHSFMSVIRRERRTPSDRLQGIAEQMARQVGLKRTPQIATSLISNGPLVTGLVRPIVLLPAWFESDYDDAQQRAALAHELTHVKRGDLWALQLAELFVACLWFNPLAYIARQAFRTDQEAACDSDVLRCGAASPHAYGSTLLKAVRISVPERLPLGASLPLTHSLKERMRLLTYPTPSPRRRLAGLGLTAVLGSFVLAATASVSASAGEPEKDLASTITIDDATLFIDGQKVEDRQFVLLGDPFETAVPDTDQKIRKLSKLIEKETHKLRLPPPVPPAPAMQPMPPLPASQSSVELQGGEHGMNRVFVFNGTEEVSEKTAAEWDAWANEFEAATEAWRNRVDAQMGNWEAEYDAESEASNREIEARIESWSREIETRVEQAYGAGMEHQVEEASNSVDSLVTSCRDANLAPGETRILRHETGSGDAFHAACVHGDISRLKAPETLAVIENSDELCDEEKQAFTSKLASTHKMEISRH